jgi:hypothetical protein
MVLAAAAKHTMSWRTLPGNPHLQCALLCAIVLAVLWPTLFAGVPRADHIMYLHQAGRYDRLADLLIRSITWNRTEVAAGDAILFRPLLYLILALQYYFLHYAFWAWQAVSLAFHLATVCVAHALLWRGALRGSAWPFLLSALFGVSYLGAEMVLWSHIVGYLAFCLFRALSLLFLLRYLDQQRLADLAWAALLALASNLTYETGILFDAMIATALVFGRHYRAATAFALSATIPIALNLLTMTSVTHARMEESSLFEAVPLALYATTMWLFALIAPLAVDVYPGSRATFHTTVESLIDAPALANYAIALCFFTSAAILLWQRRPEHIDRRLAITALVGIGCLGAYAFVIAWGRLVPRGFYSQMAINAYYAYTSYFLVLAGVAAIATCWSPRKAQGRIVSMFAVTTTICLIAINGYQTSDLAQGMRAYSEPREELVLRVAELVLTKDATFTVDASCPDDKLSWFPPSLRVKRWPEPPTISEALFPEHSARLNPSPSAHVIWCP